MKFNLIAMLALVAGSMLAQGRDGYGQPSYGYDNNGYNQSYEVRSAPPPPVRAYGYRRPVMPGQGFVWVDGYWSWMRGRYVWVTGYWTRPPFVGGYWMAPRYDRGRFFAGFWAGNRNWHRGGGYRR